jgi:hypothetical protein
MRNDEWEVWNQEQKEAWTDAFAGVTLSLSGYKTRGLNFAPRNPARAVEVFGRGFGGTFFN